jgi:alpha-tubulin suppressor-like RCC1 family protein
MKRLCEYLLLLALLLLLLPAGALADDLLKDDFARVSCGASHTLALRNNGDLWAWGLNDRGQIGNDGASDSFSSVGNLPCQAKPVLVLDQVADIAAGGTHSLALREDGSLWGWGMNYRGRLGFNGAEHVKAPQKVMDDVQAVAAGAHFSLILKNDGSLWACGNNDLGQLGNGAADAPDDTAEAEPPESAPQKIMEQVTAIAAGDAHALALREDGSLWAWGHNLYGQVGNGGATDLFDTCQSKPVRVFESGVCGLAAGDKISLALTEDGDLWGWGYNGAGCLLESEQEILTTPQLLLTGVRLACAGSARVLVIKEDGSLWGWGDNAFQAMNYNYKAEYVSADPKKILDNVVHVSSGPAHTMAVQADGTLWGWGDNSFGQLAQELGPQGLPVRIRVEYPAWAEEPAEAEEAPPAPVAEEGAGPAVAEAQAGGGNPLPFIIGCGVIAAGGLTAFLLWRKKRKDVIGEWRK